jgi:hypothetical protein
MQALKESGALRCLDKLDVNGDPLNTNLYGRDDISPYRRIDFLYVPCLTYKLMTLSEKNREETECYATMDDSYEVQQEKLQETIKYLKKPDLQVIYNSERINTE